MRLLTVCVLLGISAAVPAQEPPEPLPITAPITQPPEVDWQAPTPQPIGPRWSTDLMVGLPTAIRAQRRFNDESAWMVEGLAGLHLVLCPTIGGGIRRRCEIGDGKDALFLNPGVDAYFIVNPFIDLFGGGGSSLGGGVAVDVDIGWRHLFNESGGTEMGLKIGAGAVEFRRGGVMPILSVFFGARY
jgi:hypothetical protein